MELYEHFEDFFWAIGYFGWQESAVYALYVSYLISWFDMLVFIVVFLMSGWLNHTLLKNYIYDPRPKESKAFLATEHIKLHTNGMPSGHAQLTAFSLVYAYLLTGRRFYESLALFGLTIFQRYIYKNHTLAQLVAGSVLGIVTAYATIYFLKFVKKRKIRKENKQK